MDNEQHQIERLMRRMKPELLTQGCRIPLCVLKSWRIGNLRVAVGGAMLKSHAIYRDVSIVVDGENMSGDLSVLETKGYDMLILLSS